MVVSVGDNHAYFEAQRRGDENIAFIFPFLVTGYLPVMMLDAPPQRRERLGDYVMRTAATGQVLAVPLSYRDVIRGGEAVLSGARVPMVRAQILVDPPPIGPLMAAVGVHLLVLWLAVHHSAQIHGTPNGTQQPQVEMVFDAPPVKHSMRGPATHEVGGGAKAPAPTAPKEATQVPLEPTPHTPSSPALVSSPTGELTNAEASQRPVSRAEPKRRERNKATPTHQQQTRQSETNPFAHPMDLSFDGEPSEHPLKRGRRGGTGGPVDFSLGPLSLNGQINAPYKTSSSVKGVSSDYGSEIDSWIRAHMFYPDEAVAAGEEGPASVHVVIDRSGRVTKVRLTDQSGSYSLDAATTGMFQGAQLPPVPPDMKGDHFDLDVTINYMLIRR